MPSIMKGLILSGGRGTRLRPLTYSQQKQLIPIANKPVLFYAIEQIAKCGIKEIGIIVGPNKEQIRGAVGDGSFWDVRITYIEQDTPLGLAHAVKISSDFLKNEPFIMYLGDNILNGSMIEHINHFKNSKADASILLAKVKNPSQFGVAELNSNGSVKKLIEKPKNPPSEYALVGVYIFGPEIHQAVNRIKPSKRNELEITDAIQNLIDTGKKIESTIVEGWWKDTGRPEDILEANHLVLDELTPKNEGLVCKGSEVKGKVRIGKGTTVREGCIIKGPAVIGKNCMIGPNTYIGPYTSIGDNSRIAHSEIEYSVILDDAMIDCAKKIVDSLIGRGVRISERAKLPKGHKFVIGDHSEVEI